MTNIPHTEEMNNRIVLRKEFYEKMMLSYAKGGFLTTDADGSWEIDKKLIADFWLSKLSSQRKEIAEWLLEQIGEDEQHRSWCEVYSDEYKPCNCEQANFAVNQERSRLRSLAQRLIDDTKI